MDSKATLRCRNMILPNLLLLEMILMHTNIFGSKCLKRKEAGLDEPTSLISWLLSARWVNKVSRCFLVKVSGYMDSVKYIRN